MARVSWLLLFGLSPLRRGLRGFSLDNCRESTLARSVLSMLRPRHSRHGRYRASVALRVTP